MPTVFNNKLGRKFYEDQRVWFIYHSVFMNRKQSNKLRLCIYQARCIPQELSVYPSYAYNIINLARVSWCTLPSIMKTVQFEATMWQNIYRHRKKWNIHGPAYGQNAVEFEGLFQVETITCLIFDSFFLGCGADLTVNNTGMIERERGEKGGNSEKFQIANSLGVFVEHTLSPG